MGSNCSSKNQKTNKPAQPMMQSLEPRRLMSLSGAVEIAAPPAPHSAPAVHSFGFENHPFESAPGGVFAEALAQPPQFMQPRISELEAQLGSAIARGTSFTISAPMGATPTPIYSDSSDRSLSAMYTSLESSTSAAIDDASVVSHADLVAQADPAGTVARISGGTNFAAEVIRSTMITSNPIVADAVNGPLLVVTPGTGAIAPQADAEPALPHAAVPLESQLEAISLRASEAVSQLGRDMAISLAHLEDEIVGAASPAMQQLSSWRGGALVAGAMVAAVYLQSRMKEEQSKQVSVFSRKVVELEVPDRL